MAWIGDSNPNASMMIMHGPAGSGKSAIVQSIAELCLLQQWLAAAFSFSRTPPGTPSDQPRRDNRLNLFPTIAYQLCSSHPEVGLVIRIRLWKDPTLLTQKIENVVEALLIAPFFSWIYITLC
jgi:predicted alpha/beta-hydrolase family hydrolase